jgi:hypothetical protein
MNNWTKEELDEAMRNNPGLSIAGEPSRPMPVVEDKHKEPKPNKYHAVRTGHYASKREAQYADELVLRKKAGDIGFWLEQVRMPLPGEYTDKRGHKRQAAYLLDFVTFSLAPNEPGLWRIEFVEVKGKDLPMGKLKRVQTEELYGISIAVV